MCVGGCATGILQVEPRDAAKYPTMLRSVPHEKKDLAQNVNSANVEKLAKHFKIFEALKYIPSHSLTV